MTLLRTPLAVAATLAIGLATPVFSYAFGQAQADAVPSSSLFNKADVTSEVILDQSFEGLTELPEGWLRHASNKGTVSVKDGALLINGKADSYNMTGVALPPEYLEMENYRVDVDFTFLEANDGGRWGSVMYRTAASAEPYYQFAIRRDATAANGTEFAFRNNNGWNVQNKVKYSENIDPAKTYRATVIVHGERVQQYLNGKLLHEMVMKPNTGKGGIGLQTAGVLMRVDHITVTKQTKALPEPVIPVIDAQEPATSVSMAPTLVDLGGFSGVQQSRASNAYFKLSQDMQLTDGLGRPAGALIDYLRDASRNTIPALYVSDTATVAALKAMAESELMTLKDLTLISSSVEVLAGARTSLPELRAALDLSSLSRLDSDADIVHVVDQTNRAGAKIAILPASLLSKAKVAHLQRLLVTVWGQSDANTPVEVANVLLTGVNGVVTAHSSEFARVLGQLPKNTLLRKPIVVGHRGMPGTTDENTLESAHAAVQAGADAVENDIYITTDGVLVIMHDDTVNRTTDGQGKIEEMTLAQVKALRTKGGNYQVPTLQEYFDAFKDKPITHFIELKSGNAKIVPALKKLIEQNDMHNQSAMISFIGDQLNRARVDLPGVSGGLLTDPPNTGNSTQDVNQILRDTQQYASTFNPSYGNLKQATIEAAKHRGTTFWPWTVRDQSDFYKLYSWGMHGITVDDAYWAKDFPVAVLAANAVQDVEFATDVTVPVTLTSQVGEQSTADANTWVYLEGNAEPIMGSNGRLRFEGAGTATLLPGYRYNMDSTNSYVIFGAPVTFRAGKPVVGVDVSITTPSGGDVSCSAGQGNSAVCGVQPQPGYRVVQALPDGTCSAGQWNADYTEYTLNNVPANPGTHCTVQFAFEAQPVQLPLSSIGQTGTLELAVSGGGNGLWRFDDAAAPSLQEAGELPEGVSLPYGAVSFQLDAGTAGATAEVVLTYPESLPSGATYYKFGPTPEQAEPHWYEYPNATISGNTVRLRLQDGQVGDNDLDANGVIRDPGGVAVVAGAPSPANATPVPTTGVLGLLGLSALLSAFGLRSQRQAQRQRVQR
ncbi:DUF1080 domain-containing protein [Lampropedia puyangensis]|uniref:DUF1080 domain-containing protein n=1 Tax=Lampropedia puyangensis TaxID=1330072 RepID=A0A4S8FCI2_9BURK|nr:glycerophosphodiester phosphodiesterase family protein [Lampropedia puyangensis]THU05077.1 DUF1080 domain-containing protein [Lampropedia puyangensis]